ncbi:MAG: phytanoyl-CoA dioxygenase family protein [Bacteroidetes bacterium]|nr:phytanoyl-CoA dioxygenase family protein [Bacteroidota bacterium]
MKPILRDPILDRRLLDEGYVVVPFLYGAEVAELVETYYKTHPRDLQGMAATAHLPDLDMRLQMNEAVKRVFDRAIQEHFIHANPLGGSFIAKGKGQQGTLSPHQDWNIVDEREYRSFNIWVPLVDLHADNGPICIQPYSHQWLSTYRSANIGSAYQQVDVPLWETMQRLYMKAGEALIYDHRLIHASGENKTDEIRLAAVYGVIPEEADMYYYHGKDDHTVEIYSSNKEFFLYENIFEGPRKLQKVGEVAYNYPRVDMAGFLKYLKGPQPGWLERIKALFN